MRKNPRLRVQQSRLVLTRRDRRIIAAVRQFRFLTREMIQDIVGWSCTSKVNSRLRRLFDCGFLDRRFLPIQSGSAPAIYFVGAEGVDLLAGEESFDKDLLTRYRYADRNFADSAMTHALGISQLGSHFARECRLNSDMEFLEWVNERDLRRKFEKPNLMIPLRPDSFLRISRSKQVFDYFVEFDTGSESRRYLAQKIEAYTAFLSNGGFHRFSPCGTFQVLIVTARNRRVSSIARYLPANPGVSVKLSHLMATAENPSNSQVWLEPGESVATPLLRPKLVRRRD